MYKYYYSKENNMRKSTLSSASDRKDQEKS